MKFFDDNQGLLQELRECIQKVGYYPWINFQLWARDNIKIDDEFQRSGGYLRFLWICSMYGRENVEELISSNEEREEAIEDMGKAISIYRKCYDKYNEYMINRNPKTEEYKLYRYFNVNIQDKFLKELSTRYVVRSSPFLWVNKKIVTLINDYCRKESILNDINLSLEQEFLYNWAIEASIMGVPSPLPASEFPGKKYIEFLCGEKTDDMLLEDLFLLRDMNIYPIRKVENFYYINNFLSILSKLYLSTLYKIDYKMEDNIKGRIFEYIVRRIITEKFQMPKEYSYLTQDKVYSAPKNSEDLDFLYMDERFMLLFECKAKSPANNPENAYQSLYSERGDIKNICDQLAKREKSAQSNELYTNSHNFIEYNDQNIIKIGIVLNYEGACEYNEGTHIIHIEGLVMISRSFAHIDGIVEYLEFRASYIEEWDVAEEIDILAAFFNSGMEGYHTVLSDISNSIIIFNSDSDWIDYLRGDYFDRIEMMKNKSKNKWLSLFCLLQGERNPGVYISSNGEI